MQIKYLGGEKFEIRSKEAKIELGYKIKVDEFEFPGPGEYEKSGIFIEGIVDNGTTIYKLRAEEMDLCYLGNIGHDLKEEETKAIGNVDILFLPLGEDNSLPLKKALDIVSKIDPRVLIPMLFSDISEFKKSEGIDDGEMDVFKIKKIDLPEDERMNVILKAN